MLKRALIVVVISLISCVSISSELKSFTSDGCSFFPDGTLKQKKLWLGCCVAHDYDYWQGGTALERAQSDEKLEQCVKKVGEPIIGRLMLRGVRVGGSPFFPTPFRWGYGWSYPRGYKALNKEEIKLISSKRKEAEKTIKEFSFP